MSLEEKKIRNSPNACVLAKFCRLGMLWVFSTGCLPCMGSSEQATKNVFSLWICGFTITLRSCDSNSGSVCSTSATVIFYLDNGHVGASHFSVSWSSLSCSYLILMTSLLQCDLNGELISFHDLADAQNPVGMVYNYGPLWLKCVSIELRGGGFNHMWHFGYFYIVWIEDFLCR